jgi:hypothetical protein
MLYLYHAPPSVCAMKVRLVLNEKGLPWDGKILDLRRGDQFDLRSRAWDYLDGGAATRREVAALVMTRLNPVRRGKSRPVPSARRVGALNRMRRGASHVISRTTSP